MLRLGHVAPLYALHHLSDRGAGYAVLATESNERHAACGVAGAHALPARQSCVGPALPRKQGRQDPDVDVRVRRARKACARAL